MEAPGKVTWGGKPQGVINGERKKRVRNQKRIARKNPKTFHKKGHQKRGTIPTGKNTGNEKWVGKTGIWECLGERNG